MVKFEYEPHSPTKLYKAIPWLVCRYCGLVFLSNDFTKFCIDKGCNNKDHPQYMNVMKDKR